MFEGIAAKKATASAQQALKQANLRNAYGHLTSSGFLDRSDVLEAIQKASSGDDAALRELISLELTKKELQAQYLDSDGYKVYEQVLLLEEIPGGYRNRDEFSADNPNSSIPLESIIEEGGKIYQRRTDVDLMVNQLDQGGQARIERIEQVKSGRRDKHSRAMEQIEKSLSAIHRIAEGDPTVIMYYQGQNITSIIDASSATEAQVVTREPSGKTGFDQSLELTSKQIEKLVKLIIEF